MLNLYPPIKPFKRHSLDVDNDHTLYFDESGNPLGIPIIFLHGGPGNGCNRHSRRYFDPHFYRIISLDQRGCGRSTPHGSLENNNTQSLIDDLEAVRNHLSIGRWALLGDGWGGTLALLYAIEHSDNVLAIISSGISLGRKQDIDWAYKNGTRHVFPDYWKQFVKHLPEDEQDNPLPAYYNRLTKETNELAKMSLAKDWGLWATRCATLRPNQEAIDTYQESHRAQAMAKISTHFAINNLFIEDNLILKKIDAIAHIPSILVHGRYDMISPVENAYTLNKKWPAAECHIVRDAGHLLIEPGIQDALVRATGTIARRFKNEFNLGRTS